MRLSTAVVFIIYSLASNTCDAFAPHTGKSLIQPTNSILQTTKSFSTIANTVTKRREEAFSRQILLEAKSNKSNKNQDDDGNNKNNDDENDEDTRAGMADAFNSLDSLSSLDLSDLDPGSPTSKTTTTTTLKADALDEILKQDRETAEASAGSDDLSKEAKLYSERYKEMEGDADDDDIYDDILGEMGSGVGSGVGFGKSSSNDSKSKVDKVMDDADGIGDLLGANDDEEQLTAVNLSQDTDAFLKKALEEALAEAKKSAPEDKMADPNSILNDKEMMAEINAVFENANKQLLESVADIRKEQNELSKASAESRSEAVKLEEQRLAEAQGSVSRLVDQVKKETESVEAAMADLEAAKEELTSDPLSQAADLKKAGFVKQSALVGAVLFTLRTVGDLSLMSGPDAASHEAAALVQGVLALACVALFIIL